MCLGFDWETARRNILAVRPEMHIVQASARTGTGVAQLVEMLEARGQAILEV